MGKSDGREAGPVLVKDINPGPERSGPVHLTKGGDRLFFVAEDGTPQGELWVSDGTLTGTMLVSDSNPITSSNPNHLTLVNNRLYFSADDGPHGTEPWAVRNVCVIYLPIVLKGNS